MSIPSRVYFALINCVILLSGEPTANIFAPSLEQFVATASGASMLLEQSTDEYFRSVEGQPGFTEALAHVKKQRIVYVSGVSRAPAPNSAVDQPSPNCTMVVWFILRRVDDTTRLSILFYIVLKEAMILRKVISKNETSDICVRLFIFIAATSHRLNNPLM